MASHRPGRSGSVLGLAALGLIWAVAVIAGMASLVVYKQTPGPQPGQVPALAAASVPLKPELMLLLHPQCPCSEATVEELDRIATASHGRLAIKVLFVQPEKPNSEWENASLVERARKIRGVEVDFDRGGKIAKQFGVATSGQAILFDLKGKPIFHGGITASRGHEGDNVGASAILAFLKSGKVPIASTPVFGCLFGDLGSGENS